MQSKPISVTRVQTLLSQRAKLLTDVNNSLKGGPPINWEASERAAYTAQLRALGFHLVTQGQARALGLDIAPGTLPVGRGEFGPPISQFLDLLKRCRSRSDPQHLHALVRDPLLGLGQKLA